jgi:hypothetical protein
VPFWKSSNWPKTTADAADGARSDPESPRSNAANAGGRVEDRMRSCPAGRLDRVDLPRQHPMLTRARGAVKHNRNGGATAR